MKYVFILVLSYLPFGSNGQQRIGLTLNTRLNSLNFTGTYQKVIKGPLLVSIGAGAGSFGHSDNEVTNRYINNNNGFGSSYTVVPNEVQGKIGTCQLVHTKTAGKGMFLSAGFGVFKEFQNYQGIRFNLNNEFTWAHSEISGYYQNPSAFNSVTTRKFQVWHPIGAISLEVYHTMRMTGRYTMFWGIKLPYHYSLDKGRFSPRFSDELFYNFRGELAVGFTKAIGSCD